MRERSPRHDLVVLSCVLMITIVILDVLLGRL